jgi:hypothetical protein
MVIGESSRQDVGTGGAWTAESTQVECYQIALSKRRRLESVTVYKKQLGMGTQGFLYSSLPVPRTSGSVVMKPNGYLITLSIPIEPTIPDAAANATRVVTCSDAPCSEIAPARGRDYLFPPCPSAKLKLGERIRSASAYYKAESSQL